ncbi:MAG: HAMP domain-containing histidine kinase [Saprospiraceae bacterium]|nr:HAMP domain-containing histidine kinase [Saprospiraceae bacterium]
MDIYSRASKWKLYLAIGGIFIIAASMVYTQYLARQLAKQEERQALHWQMANEIVNSIDEEEIDACDYTLQGVIMTSNTTIPVILVDSERGTILDAINFGPDLDDDKEYLAKVVARLQRKPDFEPIKGFGADIYFLESRLLRQLRYFPVVQLLLISGFILFGYMSFNSARRAEQNRVWVGMAKETAHQLGTPISAIIAWVEHVKMIREKDEEVMEIMGELNNDVERLNLIADRFSKIGSTPKLQPIDIYEELEKCRAYMVRRAPRRVSFEFPHPASGRATVMVNPPLFDWVIENLLRNALDAMEGRGTISATVVEEKGNIHIDVSDTGKGIPAGKFKRVFQPGFTTKKRGWGLGLSLAKRIIEEYHSGKIFVKKSVENEGTTFSIILPKGDQLLVKDQAEPVEVDRTIS